MSKFKDILRLLAMDMARLVSAPALLLYRNRRVGLDGAPYKKHIQGGVIIVANHIDFGDPFVLGTTFWYRRMWFLCAKEVMGDPFRRVLLKGVGCVEIDREGNDINAIRKCVGLLKKGKCLAIFPQGGIQQSAEVEQIKAGAILIALQAGVPILPAYSEKRKKWWQRRKIVVGAPMRCADYCQKKFPGLADIEMLTGLLLEKMEECEKAYEQKK